MVGEDKRSPKQASQIRLGMAVAVVGKGLRVMLGEACTHYYTVQNQLEGYIIYFESYGLCSDFPFYSLYAQVIIANAIPCATNFP